MVDLDEKYIFNSDVVVASLQSNSYKTANPYPHIVIDNLFVPDVLEKILREWVLNKDVNHEEHNDGTFVKSKVGTNTETIFPVYTEFFLYLLTKPKFLKYLENLTGIGALIADPYNFGGGLHETRDGGKLAVHTDYNKHLIYKLDRRLNLLIYLNKDWTPEMHGELEMWDHSMTECVVKVLPVFNRTVIFSTIPTAFHGQPDPVTCGEHRSRKSIALYYFSNGRPEEPGVSPEETTTIWQARPVKGY